MAKIKRLLASAIAMASTFTTVASMSTAFAYDNNNLIKSKYIASLDSDELVRIAELSFEDGLTMEETISLVEWYESLNNRPMMLSSGNVSDYYRTNGKSNDDHFLAIVCTNLSSPLNENVRYTGSNNAVSFLNSCALTWDYYYNSQASMSLTYNNSTDVQTHITAPAINSGNRVIGKVAFNILGNNTERTAYNAISQQKLNGYGYVTYATYIRGDVNHDGYVNENDSHILMDYMVGNISSLNFSYAAGTAPSYAEDINRLAADFTMNNSLTMLDVVRLNQHLGIQ